jgi:hypothetical protein
MTKWLEAAKRTTGREAMEQPQPGPQPVLSVVSVLSQGVTPQPRPAKAQPHEDFPYGTACDLGLMPKTWTGRVVSLADWRTLSEWERHGPNGRIWCGLCQGWHWPGDCEDGGVG